MILLQINPINVTTTELKGNPPRSVDGHAVTKRIAAVKRISVEP
jgi:hypothetical protein